MTASPSKQTILRPRRSVISSRHMQTLLQLKLNLSINQVDAKPTNPKTCRRRRYLSLVLHYVEASMSHSAGVRIKTQNVSMIAQPILMKPTDPTLPHCKIVLLYLAYVIVALLTTQVLLESGSASHSLNQIIPIKKPPISRRFFV